MAREMALLANPSAGRGRGHEHATLLTRRLRDAGIVVRSLTATDADSGAHLARESVADGVDGLVVCGGDATVHLGVQAVAGTGVPLGVVPAGTANTLARGLGLRLDDPGAAADVVVAQRTRPVDLARSGSRWYLSVLAAGRDAVVARRAEQMRWPRGAARYRLAVLPELRRHRAQTFTLDLAGRQLRVEATTVAVSTGPVLTDGLLEVVVRRHGADPERHRVRRVTVAAPGATAYADGVRFGTLPMTIECAPGALEVFA